MNAVDLKDLAQALDHCLLADRRALRRRLDGLRRRLSRGQPVDRGLPALREAVERSRGEAERRRRGLPRPGLNRSLPVFARHREIAAAIRDHQVVVVCGETGSGKTTQLPQICLQMGRGVYGLIGHTQPRRIAARSVAERIAEELGCAPGTAVGYKMRFSDRFAPSGYVKLMTDGILLAEIQSDPRLEQYDTLIIDEAHERSLNIDFLLGYLHRLLPSRPDLRVIITSATIDPERFARHFHDAPVINVSGRTYPVELRYRPLEGGGEGDREQTEGVLAAVDELCGEGPGDILVFLAGEREIRETAEALRKHHPPETEVLPLFARLSAREQHRVFEGHRRRRIVLATNVAETSLTVPGIRFVVDAGRARISRYSLRSKVQRLPIEDVSRASASQRSGRCGRVSAGVCIRLYAEADFLARPEFTEPEILRTNLAAVILQMEALGLGAVEDFPFVDPPDSRQINDGYRLLHELGAVDQGRHITHLGRELHRLPVDPRLGRMVLAAREFGCLAEVLVVVAALSIQDPRERPLEAREAADTSHGRFADPRSDFMALLNLWRYYHDQERHLSRSKLRRLCRAEFLSWLRMREWQDVCNQLRAQVSSMGMRLNQAEAGYEEIHQALTAGLLSHAAVKDEQGRYRGARDRRLQLWPGTGVRPKGLKWLVAAELVETGRLYARTVARIEPEWLERLGAHLVKRSHGNPRWSKRAAAAVVDEQVSLFGLVIVPRRPVSLAGLDRQEARRIFIEEALVRGHYDSRADFLRHNRALLAEVEDLEARARRRDLLVDEADLCEFYDRLLPADVWDGSRFERWRRQAERRQPELLRLRPEQVLRGDAAGVTAARFPQRLDLQGMRLPLSYSFRPGESGDGVTVSVPVAALEQLGPGVFQWLVPGMLEDKITALIKTLPKGLRRHFVPAPEFARACAESLRPGGQPLLEALSQRLQELTGVEVPVQAWREPDLPPHLRMNIRLLAPGGGVLAEGRDLQELRDGFGEVAASSFESALPEHYRREGITNWDFGDLPESISVSQGPVDLTLYPSLVDRGQNVALTLVDTPRRAAHELRGGVLRLLLLRLGKDARRRLRDHPDMAAMGLRYAAVDTSAALQQDLLLRTAAQVFLPNRPLPRTREAFQAMLDAGRGDFADRLDRNVALMGRILAAYHPIAAALKESAGLAGAHQDMREQLRHLVFPEFFRLLPDGALPRLPVYLQAMHSRLEKLRADPRRDRSRSAELMPFWQRCLPRLNSGEGVDEPAFQRYRWLLEEYRISLFAQHLRTSEPVSAKRLSEQWRRVEEALQSD